MYKLESYDNGFALVTSDDPNAPYRASHNAASAEEAERLVVRMNQPGMLSQLAEYRLGVETGGLTLTDGLRVQTDRESQAQLNSTYADLKEGLIPDTDWKAANGWQVVDLATMKPIAQAMAAHRRACFRGESFLIAAINAATTLALQEAISIEADFMAAYQAAYSEVMVPA
jgi:hypothetical protein